MTEPIIAKTKARRPRLKVAILPDDDETPARSAHTRSADTLTLRIKSRSTTEDAGRLIAEAAYYRAEKRGFAPGYEMEDWIAAEREVQEQLEKS